MTAKPPPSPFCRKCGRHTVRLQHKFYCKFCALPHKDLKMSKCRYCGTVFGTRWAMVEHYSGCSKKPAWKKWRIPPEQRGGDHEVVTD